MTIKYTIIYGSEDGVPGRFPVRYKNAKAVEERVPREDVLGLYAHATDYPEPCIMGNVHDGWENCDGYHDHSGPEFGFDDDDCEDDAPDPPLWCDDPKCSCSVRDENNRCPDATQPMEKEDWMELYGETK
jgi:hypothetical protein